MNTKQRILFFAALILLVSTPMLWTLWNETGNKLFQGLTCLTVAFGVICAVGTWAAGLEPLSKSETGDQAEQS